LKKWYNDEKGEFDTTKKPRCLVEVIDSFYAKPRPLKRPMRACVYDFYQNIQDGFSVCQGECMSLKVESGILKKKDKLVIMPQNIDCEIKAIEF
jgi:translation elongation factor EF-1alpha